MRCSCQRHFRSQGINELLCAGHRQSVLLKKIMQAQECSDGAPVLSKHQAEEWYDPNGTQKKLSLRYDKRVSHSLVQRIGQGCTEDGNTKGVSKEQNQDRQAHQVFSKAEAPTGAYIFKLFHETKWYDTVMKGNLNCVMLQCSTIGCRFPSIMHVSHLMSCCHCTVPPPPAQHQAPLFTSSPTLQTSSASTTLS